RARGARRRDGPHGRWRRGLGGARSRPGRAGRGGGGVGAGLKPQARSFPSPLWGGGRGGGRSYRREVCRKLRAPPPFAFPATSDPTPDAFLAKLETHRPSPQGGG